MVVPHAMAGTSRRILSALHAVDGVRCSLWEGFFADAYGTGEAAYHTVKGLQDAGTMATAKHLIGYEQETFR